MKRILVVAVVVGFAAAASASTLTVVSDKTTYSPGETITLTVSGTQTGGSVNGVFGRLDYTGAGTVTPSTQTQKLVGKAANGWQAGPLANGVGFSESFNQLNGSGGGNADNLPGNNPFSTITAIAGLVGTVNVNWHAVIDGSQLNFFGFGVANAPPGTSFTIVPEPATVALVGLGLLGLALGGRRRA